MLLPRLQSFYLRENPWSVKDIPALALKLALVIFNGGLFIGVVDLYSVRSKVQYLGPGCTLWLDGGDRISLLVTDGGHGAGHPP